MIVGSVTHIRFLPRLSLARFKTLALLSLLVFVLPAIFVDTTAQAAPRPRLSYLLSNQENLNDLASELDLTVVQKHEVKLIIEQETEELRKLKEVSDLIVESKGRSLSAKKDQIGKMGFNAQVEKRESSAIAQIKAVVGNKSIAFDKWFDQLWAAEVAAHGIAAFGAASSSLAYQVFATQYYGYTNYEVALPDKYIKFANLGWEHQPGYERSDYAVDLSYGGNSLTDVAILDVGPWNTDDNYWNAAGISPRPRRLFADLPQGMPEAQAAFFDNYNGGQDQFGRTVLNPAGIDLTPAVAADLGIGELQNKWIDVSYIKADASQAPVSTMNTPLLSSDLTKKTRFKVRWSATESYPTPGIASFDVQYKISGRSWRNWKMNTTARAAYFTGRAGRTYYFRAKARDNNGRIGKYSSANRTTVPYDGNKLILRRTGFGNTHRNTRSRFYQNTLRYSTIAGEQIVYKFVGRRVYLISTKSKTRSKAMIYVDGRYIKTINTWSRGTKYRQIVFKKSWNKRGTHTIRIINIGNKRRFDIDGLGVMR